MRKTLPFLLLFSILISLGAQAGEKNSNVNFSQSKWYFGLRGGVPFAFSTFSSLQADKVRAGWTAGLYGGYRFNPVLSLEASAVYGKVGVGAQSCCDYWLGADGRRYNAPVTDMEGNFYKSLYSTVTMQQYGAHLNINLLGLFESTRNSRWLIQLSPSLYGIGTKANIKLIDGGQSVLKRNTAWHIGLGGDLVVDYRISPRFNVGVYSGVTYLTGARLDGMPKYLHRNNYTWESGIRFGITLGKCRNKAQTTPAMVLTQQPVAEPTQPTEVEQPTEKPVQPATEPAKPVEQPVTEPAKPVEQPASTQPAEQQPAKEIEPEMPLIYFSFNSIWIEPSERVKIKRIAQMMKADPAMNIRVIGHTDSRGTDEANRRVSLKRAEAVKKMLGAWLIPADRITIEGAGIDHSAETPTEARNAASIEINK